MRTRTKITGLLLAALVMTVWTAAPVASEPLSKDETHVSEAMMGATSMIAPMADMDSAAQECAKVADNLEPLVQQNQSSVPMQRNSVEGLQNMGLSMQSMAEDMNTMMGSLHAMLVNPALRDDPVMLERMNAMRARMKEMATMVEESAQDLKHMSTRLEAINGEQANAR